MRWVQYPELEPHHRLPDEGRELLNHNIWVTEKRDGENVSLWLDDESKPRISSRRLEEASPDIILRVESTPTYRRTIEFLTHEAKQYGSRYIAYGELLKGVSPARLEPRKKHVDWILFDLYRTDDRSWVPYERTYQFAYQWRIPIVRLVEIFCPKSLPALSERIPTWLKWAKKHRREGIVGKTYHRESPVFFKEKIDLPKIREHRPSKSAPIYPPMPEEKILRALQHAYDELGSPDKWKETKLAMPVVAKHIAAEAREHFYTPPANLYRIYLETPIEKIIPR